MSDQKAFESQWECESECFGKMPENPCFKDNFTCLIFIVFVQCSAATHAQRPFGVFVLLSCGMEVVMEAFMTEIIRKILFFVVW